MCRLLFCCGPWSWRDHLTPIVSCKACLSTLDSWLKPNATLIVNHPETIRNGRTLHTICVLGLPLLSIPSRAYYEDVYKRHYFERHLQVGHNTLKGTPIQSASSLVSASCVAWRSSRTIILITSALFHSFVQPGMLPMNNQHTHWPLRYSNASFLFFSFWFFILTVIGWV